MVTPHPMPPYDHDIMSVYLVTSRDGELFDLSSVYSYNRLLPRGACAHVPARNASGWLEASMRGCDFDHGYVQPASHIVTSDDGRHHLHYEGRPVRHEERWSAPARIGVASWAPHRLAGLTRAPDAPADVPCGTVRLRPFVLNGSLTLNADAPPSTSSITVQILEPSPTAGGLGARLLHGRAAGDDQRLQVQWDNGHPKALRGRLCQVVVRLCGAARLYAFTVGTEPPPASTQGGETASSCLLYTSPSPRDLSTSRMPSSA